MTVGRSMQIADTQSISIDAPPAAVLRVVADPTTLPDWAPGFARAVRRDGDAWIVETEGGEARIHVRVTPRLGTVDFLVAGVRPEVGAFSRVIPNGCGSEYSFTQFIPDREDVGQRRAVVADELARVRALCERER